MVFKHLIRISIAQSGWFLHLIPAELHSPGADRLDPVLSIEKRNGFIRLRQAADRLDPVPSIEKAKGGLFYEKSESSFTFVCAVKPPIAVIKAKGE